MMLCILFCGYGRWKAVVGWRGAGEMGGGGDGDGERERELSEKKEGRERERGGKEAEREGGREKDNGVCREGGGRGEGAGVGGGRLYKERSRERWIVFGRVHSCVYMTVCEGGGSRE